MSSKKYIFSIGIDKYSSEHWNNLNNAVLDAKELKNILLAKYSFEDFPNNLYDINATKSEIFTSFNTLNQSISEEDYVVIFFAGHGSMDPNTRKGFWIPSDGTLDRSTWIENSSIKNFISDCPAKHILLIIDSCFSGTFLSTTRNGSLEQSYSYLDSKKSRWVISSGNEEKVSDGLPNEHSPFCRKVLDFLKKNDNENFSISELFNYVQLLISSNNSQKPQCNYIDNVGHDDGQLIFVLSDNIKSYHKKTIGIPNSRILKQEYLSSISKSNRLAAGKEILIVKSMVAEFDFMIVENFRFNDSNEKKIKFKDNFGILDLNDLEKNWDVIRRFATLTGLYNYIDNNPNIVNEKTIFLRAHEGIDSVEDELYSVYYSQYLIELLNLNPKKMHCLHCGEKISDNSSYLIEFDDYGYDTTVGNVHHECLRNIDRILGKSIYEDLHETNFLKNFDFEKWLHLLENGQGQLTNVLRNKNLFDIKIISWNPESNQNHGQFCIKESFDNGETSFIMLGKQIQRFSEKEVHPWLEKFSESIELFKPCKIVESKVHGDIEIIQQILEPGQTISYVISYEKARYSKLFEVNNIDIINDYTPLCYFTNKSDEILIINDLVPFITNPEVITEYIDNWQNLMSVDEGFKIKIVESDLELGNLIAIYYKEDKLFVINPKFDRDNQKLKSGLLIKTIDQILNEIPESRSEFRKGDIVEILINPNAKRKPLGFILEDEFIDDIGDSCVIFSPFEDGEILEMMYKMPVKKIRKVEFVGSQYSTQKRIHVHKFLKKIKYRKIKLQISLKIINSYQK